MNLSLNTQHHNTQSDSLLKEAMLYVASKSEGDPKFGATKLNKILFFADFLSFKKNGKAITGAKYMRLDHGPVPKRLVPMRKELEKEKGATMQTKSLMDGRDQHRLIALRTPDLSGFSAAEVETLDMVIEHLRHRTAEEVSTLSHGVAWEIASDGEEIPYEAAFFLKPKVDPCDEVTAARLAEN